MTVTAEFPPDDASVAAARRLVDGALPGVPAHVRDRALLMVSELATNALKHAGSGFSISIDHTGGVVRLEVTDSGAGSPVVRHPSPAQPTGRGLQIVGALCRDWGVRPGPNGKVVWFALPVNADGTAAARS